MNIVTEFLSNLGMWPRRRLSQHRIDQVHSVLNAASQEANQLAGELETLADHTDDPFAVFAHRARRSQFHRQIERGEDDK